IAGHPIMTVFLWANESPFENSLAQYTSASLPVGIDPTNPVVLQTVNSINGTASVLNLGSNATATLPQDSA
ncbi:hypothetical protein ACLMJK_001930, partial [Lecanora helva]